MKSSSCRGMEVFDFNSDDEPSDDKYSGKLKNPSLDDDSILKYKFLECVPPVSNISARQTDVHCVDVDELKDDCLEDKYTYTMREDNVTQQYQPNFSFSMLFDTLAGVPHNHCSLVNQKCGNSFSESAIRSPSPVASSGRRTNSALSDSLSNEECADVSSDVDDSMNSQASSVASDVEEDVSLEGQPRNDHIRSPLVGSNEGIFIFPEYAIYRGDYYIEPLLAFSPSGVKFKGSATNPEVKGISAECAIDDIVNISGQWFPKVETVLLKILIISKDAVQVDNMQEFSGAEELKFAVVDANWSETQEIIRAFNGKYADVWDVVIDADLGMDVVDASGQRSYFPSFDEPFEELVYPKGDSDAVSISKGDVDLLQPETFINDTIVDFYIKYLKNQIPHEERQRFYFFNSFFFRKLADLDKDPNSASDGRAAFLRVRKWTRKFNLFEKDYIFIPVNYSLHWSLIVICHPGEVANFGDEDLLRSAKVPCILHMDSIRGSHAGLKNLIQCYLWEEWKEKGNETSEHISEKFSDMLFVHLELPQQENSYDCGLFLLHYLELFLTQAPTTFNPMKLSKLSRFLNPDWFPPVEASLKRTVIQKLIHELLGGRNHSSKTVDTKIDNGFGGASLAETCGSIPQASNGIEISLLPEADSSLRNPQSTNNESGIVLREFFESEPADGSFLGSCQSYDQPSYYPLNKNPVSAMELEDVEAGTEYGFAPYAEINRVAPQSDCIRLGLLENIEDKVVANSQEASPRTPDITVYDSSNDKDCIRLGLLENIEDKAGADSKEASPRTLDITVYDSSNDKDCNRLGLLENIENKAVADSQEASPRTPVTIYDSSNDKDCISLGLLEKIEDKAVADSQEASPCTPDITIYDSSNDKDCISLGLLEKIEAKAVADSQEASPCTPDITTYDSSNDKDISNDKDANLSYAENLTHFGKTEIGCCSDEVVFERLKVDEVMQKSEQVVLESWDIDKKGKLEEVPPLEAQDADKMNLIQDTKEEMVSETLDGETREYVTPPESPVKSLHQEVVETELFLVDERENDTLHVEIGTEKRDFSDITVVVDPEEEEPDAKRRRLLEDNNLHL